MADTRTGQAGEQGAPKGAAGIPARYRRERLSPYNIGSVYIRNGLLDAIRGGVDRWRQALAKDAEVLDVGCGRQPYRALIEAGGFRYTGADWPNSIHTGDAAGEVVACDLARMPWPFEAGRFDALLCTEVLEHVPAPGSFLAECRRVLRDGGRILLTVPLVWPEHEAPHDYHRFTRHALRRHFADAGFAQVEVEPRGGWHVTIAQLLGLWSYFAVRKPWSYATRLLAMPVMAVLAALDRPAREDDALPMTLGYTVHAVAAA
ncbi:MAG: class I SAM-dependent methyltransferase [Candidatus Sumerlaeia bacterium]|nr:class I SAM-dependent methyltransferase [Candidatus Sumerlaeia bacterium]